MDGLAELVGDWAGPLALLALVTAGLGLLLLLLTIRRRGDPVRAVPTDPAAPWDEVASAAPDARLDGLSAEIRQLVERQAAVDGRSAGLESGLHALAGRVEALEAGALRSVRHVGLVRFNPFEDTGSNQSFALALLDGAGSGVIVSSLHSRQATRVYVKPVSAGRPDGPLSAEEEAALRQAGWVPQVRVPG